MDSAIEKYIIDHIDEEGDLLHQLNRETHCRQLRPRMLSGHLQGKVLSMISQMIRPKRILEIGTYTGYSALCLAVGLCEGGEIHTIEVDDELEPFTRSFWNRSAYKDCIHLHLGDAIELIPQLEGSFDLVFIDANKRQYTDYYHVLFDRVPSGGYILADNTLWDGKVIDPEAQDEQTQGVRNFNDLIKMDSRVEQVILPLRDGLTIIRKK